MALTFLGALAISLFISGVQILMRPKVKRPKPEDFAVPKAEEGALVPQGSGIYAVAGNVVWVGDVSSRPSSSNDQVTLYFANMLIRLGIGPADELVDIQIGDRSLALTPFSKEQSVNTPGVTSILTPQLPQPLTGDAPLAVQVFAHVLFGGDLQEGGVQGLIKLYRGSLDQPIDELTIRQFDQVPGFAGLGLGTRRPGLIFLAIGTTAQPFYWGTVPQPKNVVTILRTLPHALLDLALDPDHYTSAEIGNNANPAELLYEAKRAELRGLGQAEAEFDLASFVAFAARCQAEQLGLSNPGASSVPARDTITDICTACDAVLFEDLSTGKWTVTAMRPDDRAGDVVAVTPSTVIKGSLRISRPDWSGTKTEAVLKFLRFEVSPGTPIIGELLTPNLVFHPTKVANALQLRGKDVSEVHLFDDDGSGPVEIDAAAYTVNPTSGMVFIHRFVVVNDGTGFLQHSRITANYLSGPFMGFHQASVRKEDDANRQRLGRSEPLEINSAYITNDLVAAWVCARALHKASRRLATAQFKVNRTAYALRPGSPIDVTDERTDTVIPMRVTDLDIGLLEQGEIGVEAIQDVFGAEVAPAFPPGPNTTPGAVRTAPAMAAFFCAGADELGFQASDESFSIEIWRADDTSGTGAELADTLDGDATTWTDPTPGKTHQARLVRGDVDPGPFTPWLSACTAGVSTDCTRPIVEDTPIPGPTVGTLHVDVNDPQHRLVDVAFQTQAAGGAWSEWVVATAPYSTTVPVTTGQTSWIRRRVRFYNCDGDLESSEASFSFTPEDAEPVPPPPVGLTSLPVELALIAPGVMGLSLTGLTAVATELPTERGTEDKYPLEGVPAGRLQAIIRGTTAPVGAFAAMQIEVPEAPGTWVPGDGADGPKLPIDEASLDLLDPAGALLTPKRWNVAGEWASIREELRRDVRCRPVILGATDDDLDGIDIRRLVFQPRATAADGPPSETTPEPPFEDPGSCSTPTPLDVTDHDSETAPSGAVFSVVGSDVLLTLDGTGTGLAKQTVTLHGLTPSTRYTFYLTVTTDAPAVDAFLQVVGGDTAVAVLAGGETLVARGDSDGSGDLTLSWGAQAIENAPDAAGSDDLDYADQAAAEAAGLVFTNTASGAASFGFHVAKVVGPYSRSLRMSIASGTGYIQWEDTVAVVSGQSYRVRLWGISGTGNPWYEFATLDVISGVHAAADSINGAVGGVATEKHMSATVVADGSVLTIRVKALPGGFFPHTNVWDFAGLTIEGLVGGGTTVLFSDLGSCLGTGLTSTPGVTTGGGTDGTDPVPTPTTQAGARPYGLFNLPAGGAGIYTGGVKGLYPPRYAKNVLDAAATGGQKLYCAPVNFGGHGLWRDSAGIFSLSAWKALILQVADDPIAMAALAARQADGTARGHFLIDEPMLVDRWGKTVPLTEVEQMALFSLSIWPDWPVVIRVSPLHPWLTRKINGVSLYWLQYALNQGDPASALARSLDRVAGFGAGLVVGLNVIHFNVQGSAGRMITAAEYRHYGQILASSDATDGFVSWQYQNDWYSVSGMPAADVDVRDTFASFDP